MYMNTRNNMRITFILFGLVILIASVLRFYKLDQVPSAISWDEAANGYNAYTIANWGKDEWGKTFPAYFKSFEDDKNPVHIYLTAIPVRFLGLSEFSTRLVPALFGILNVLLIFLLAKRLFLSNLTGLIAALILSISPYALQFSRFNHESTFALFFFLLGLLLFFKGIKENPKFLIFSFFSFGVDLITYHSAKIIVPSILLLLIVLYFKDLWRVRRYFFMALMALSLVLSLFLFNSELLGTARMKQASLPNDVIEKTSIFQKTQNMFLGRVELAGQRYLTYFSYNYLFESGDNIARHSTGAAGEFYKVDLPFLLLGLLGLIRLRTKAAIVLVAWVFLAPVPAAAAGGLSETGHAARALYTMGSWHLIAAFGYYSFLSLLKKPKLQVAAAVAILMLIGWEFKNYLNYYYGEYPRRYAIEWQYGMKQIGEYLKEHDGYIQVYMTDARSQPYIFLLYYLQTPLAEFLDTVTYNETQSRPSNLVSFFDKYHFGEWDPIESFPSPGVLYILTPSQYDGLRHKNEFQVKKLIKYPNGLDAYFLVSYL